MEYIAGGLATGVVAIAGGVRAFKKHEEHKEGVQCLMFFASHWLVTEKGRELGL